MTTWIIVKGIVIAFVLRFAWTLVSGGLLFLLRKKVSRLVGWAARLFMRPALDSVVGEIDRLEEERATRRALGDPRALRDFWPDAPPWPCTCGAAAHEEAAARERARYAPPHEIVEVFEGTHGAGCLRGRQLALRAQHFPHAVTPGGALVPCTCGMEARARATGTAEGVHATTCPQSCGGAP